MYNYPADLIRSGTGGSLTQSDVINAFRTYWSRYTLWTRAYITARAGGMGDPEYIARRGAENARSFAELLNRFYRYQAARSVENVMLERFTASQNVLNSIISGDEALFRDAKAKWFSLTDTLVTLLASLNPYWDLAVLREMVGAQFATLENEIRYRMSPHTQSAFDFDEAEILGERIADYLARGIILHLAIDQ